MSFVRSYMNWKEGVGVCCWEAPSKDKLEALFKGAKAPYEKIIPVEEHAGESLVR